MSDYADCVRLIVSLLKASVELCGDPSAMPPTTGYVGGDVYFDEIPQEVVLPAVRISLAAAKDSHFYDGSRSGSRAVFQVVSVSQGDDLQTPHLIAAAIDSALDNQRSTISGLSAKVSRDGVVHHSGVEAGERFNMIGGRYRVIFSGG